MDGGKRAADMGMADLGMASRAAGDVRDRPVEDPALRFDPDWFRSTYPDSADLAGQPGGPMLLQVYLTQARTLGVSPNRHFEERYYRETHQDVARSVEAGTFWSGFHHYVQHGHAERRRARPAERRVALDLRAFRGGRSDPERDSQIDHLVRDLLRLLPEVDFLLVLEPSGIEAFADVEGCNARRLPMTEHHWDMIRVLRKRGVDCLISPYGATELTFPGYANVTVADRPIGLAARTPADRAATLREWRRFDAALCASEEIRADVAETVGAEGVAARLCPLRDIAREASPEEGRAGRALLAELDAARSVAAARTVLHGVCGRTGDAEWLAMNVAPSPQRRTLSMAVRFPHGVSAAPLRLEQWLGGQLQDCIAAEPGATIRIEVPLPVDGGVLDWRLASQEAGGKWHRVEGRPGQRIQCMHAVVRQESDLVLAAPPAGTGLPAAAPAGSADAGLDRANALIAAYEPLKHALVDELFRLTTAQPAVQLAVPKMMLVSRIVRPRVLHVVKPSYLDPALLYHGSTKDILGRRNYFADRGFQVDELIVPPKEEREGQAIRTLMARRGVEYDAVFIEYLLYPELMAYLRERYPRARILVRGHNAEVLHRLDTIRARWRLGAGLGWRDRLRALGIRKQLRTVRRYLGDELQCARLADVVVSISDWETRHYWPLVVGSRRAVTVPYFVPAEIHRTVVPAERQRRVVALSSVGPGPLVLHALEIFKSLVAATAGRLPGWRFSATGDAGVDDMIRHPHINFVGTVADPIEELRGAAAMALLSPLGYGFKTKIMDAVTAGAFTLLPGSLMRRVPEELRPYCIAVDTADPASFVEALARSMGAWPGGSPNDMLRRRAYRAMDGIFGISEHPLAGVGD